MTSPALRTLFPIAVLLAATVLPGCAQSLTIWQQIDTANNEIKVCKAPFVVPLRDQDGPRNLVATSQPGGKIFLKWYPAVDHMPPKEYAIYQVKLQYVTHWASDTGDSGFRYDDTQTVTRLPFVAKVGGDTTVFTWDDLEPEKMYSFQIGALSQDGKTMAFSDVAFSQSCADPGARIKYGS